MAEIGKGAVLQLDNTSGTPQDMSSYLVDIKMGREAKSEDTTVVGGTSRAETSIPSLLSSQYTVELHANAATRTLVNALYNQGYIGTIEFGPDGSDTGDVKYTCEQYITKIGEDITPGGVKKLVVEFKGTGAVTVGAYA